MILYDREDFYKLEDVERVLGYKICTDRRHYLNAPDYWYEFDCCIRGNDKYLVQVDGEDFILTEVNIAGDFRHSLEYVNAKNKRNYERVETLIVKVSIIFITGFAIIKIIISTIYIIFFIHR